VHVDDGADVELGDDQSIPLTFNLPAGSYAAIGIETGGGY